MPPNQQHNGSNRKVVVAMSGGVDSSVAAALLVQQGYHVIGLMLRLWSKPGSECDNRCCTPDAIAQARRVAAQLDIPFYTIDARSQFKSIVVDEFVKEYARGVTPNPCLLCNRSIRWDYLLKHALSHGAHAMATGHYARLEKLPNGRIQLRRAVDQQKDQSYVLHMLNQGQLSQTILPLGDLKKSEVRQIACDLSLPVAERPDSQDLCFLGNESYVNFLSNSAPQACQPGPILAQNGERIGTHQGLPFYTIGQRKRLGVASSTPLYVIRKDIEENTLIVGELDKLGEKELNAGNVYWISGSTPVDSFRAQIQIRYRAKPIWGTVQVVSSNKIHIEFDEIVRDITPGQAAVLYNSDICLGGGTIMIS